MLKVWQKKMGDGEKPWLYVWELLLKIAF